MAEKECMEMRSTQQLLPQKKTSGITIHYVDEKYDNGKIIFQATCSVTENDTEESLAKKIHKLEHEYYPKTIAKILEENHL